MHGRIKTARTENVAAEAGTYQLALTKAFAGIGMPRPEYLKKGADGRTKTAEESAYIQLQFIWADEDESVRVADSFLKTAEYFEFSAETRYKSKLQKRLEQMLNVQLTEADGPRLDVKFDFLDEWDELMLSAREESEGRPARIEIRDIAWDGRSIFGREWLINVGVNDNGYNTVNSVAPMPKRKAQPVQEELAASSKARRAEPAPAVPAEDDLPY